MDNTEEIYIPHSEYNSLLHLDESVDTYYISYGEKEGMAHLGTLKNEQVD